jgi:hypothetical protein
MVVISREGHDISGPTSQIPTNAEPGILFFDTTASKLYVANASGVMVPVGTVSTMSQEEALAERKADLEKEQADNAKAAGTASQSTASQSKHADLSGDESTHESAHSQHKSGDTKHKK